MKNIISKFIVLITTIALLSGCNDFLNVTPKGKQLLETPKDYSDLMNATSAVTYDARDLHFITDDRWVNPIVLNNARNAPNIISVSFLWLTGESYDRGPLTNGATSGLYQTSYQHISRVSNLILSTIDQIDGDATFIEQIKAEAKMLRAYNYFVLINVFAKHYDPATAATDGGVPLRLNFDLTEKVPQATVAQVYASIEKDITEALPFLSNTPDNNFHFSKAAGYAFKAKVHLFKKEFAAAKAAALESYALNHQATDIITFVDRGKIDKVSAFVPENLFFAGANEQEIAVSSPLISQDLIDLYRENGADDMRFAGFFDYPTTVAGDDRDYAARFNTPNSQFSYNPVGLRTTEVMLMLAECYAREADYTNMNKYLTEVRIKRIKGYTTASETPSNWVDAVNIVIKERRKELLFGFNRFWDLRRLNTETELKQTLTRTIPANPASTAFLRTTATITPDSPMWIYPFPKTIIDQSIDPATGKPTINNNVPY